MHEVGQLQRSSYMFRYDGIHTLCIKLAKLQRSSYMFRYDGMHTLCIKLAKLQRSSYMFRHDGMHTLCMKLVNCKDPATCFDTTGSILCALSWSTAKIQLHVSTRRDASFSLKAPLHQKNLTENGYNVI